MKIRDISSFLESIAPISYQESYDNSGLLVGDYNTEVKNVLISLDVTEEVVQEAIDKKCELIISHHPIIFGGLKRFNGANYVERTVAKAIKNDIALYAIHTNLDNVQMGVNNKIGEILGIQNRRILDPKKGALKKLSVYVPQSAKEKVTNSLFENGAGHIGHYDECSFQSEGVGTFRAGENTNSYVGEKGIRHFEKEIKLEVVVPSPQLSGVIKAMLKAHPYEEVAYDVYSIENANSKVGSGMIGELMEEMDTMGFLHLIKDKMKAESLRYTSVNKSKISKIAWCGGSGSFLLEKAKAAGADVFITSDFKYHQFFDAENEIVIADIGHYENEQYTKELIADKLKENFSSFAVLLADTNTNPINYL